MVVSLKLFSITPHLQDCYVCANNGMCMTETCTTDETWQYLFCNVCVTMGQGGSGNFEEFCMTTSCDMEPYLEDDVSMEQACACVGATVDGVQCSYCEFCPNDGIAYDLKSQMKSGNVASGVALKCPSSDAFDQNEFDSTCPVTRISADRKKMIIYTTVSPVVAIALVGIGAGYLYSKFKHHREDPKRSNLVEESKDENNSKWSSNKLT